MTDREGYDAFLATVKYFCEDTQRHGDKIVFPCTDSGKVKKALEENKCAAILAVEDARILENDLSRVDTLWNMGVRFVTPVWGGDSCIGGAHNTENGLTEFGYEAVKKMVISGIIPDISHSSVKTAAEIMDIAEAAGRPAIATHSNSKSVWDHTRNLSDEQFRRVCALDGIVGISLCPSHLASENANVDSVIRHIDKYMELGGERHIAIGCDLDGTVPHSDFRSIADIVKIADKLSSIGYTDEVIHGIFFKNAANFVSKYI